ncbi:hypothetical protein [Streptomyces wuyuanensis]|uniref:Uncharacterized protein n=1 Tax=Streptomyces wuyuanensis TaxID=1196353 RepID=A0A1G9VXQ1_9ACTN|nr:hypothetical protein [Streptomyces wuyuanensis]SDM76697.1 hypothetical protein SAMN05444921_11327 [Streptomyces wuyuanensis]
MPEQPNRRPVARGECPSCGLSYALKADGTMRRHHGMTLAGFSTGEPCPGVGKPPSTAP